MHQCEMQIHNQTQEKYLTMYSYRPDPTLSLSVSRDEKQLPGESPSNGLLEAPRDADLITDHKDAAKSPTPETTMSTEAPTDQSLVSGELAEDVMDISGSEDEDTVVKNDTLSSANATPPIAESDSEETYEPPLSFEAIEEDPTSPADSKQQHPDSKRSSRQASLAPEPLTPPAENKATSDIQDVVEDEASVALLPNLSGHAPSPIDLSDSDDYEPPEATALVDVAPITHDTAAATSESSFSPPDANQDAEAELTSPGQSLVGSNPAITEVAEAATGDPEKVCMIALNFVLRLCF
ncbi:MAG: hypothetical protein Q9225_002191 [Loekoesia sp. 1 TL-2023]